MQRRTTSVRVTSLVVTLGFLLSTSGLAVLAQGETATIQGGVLDPDGGPAAGSRVVVRDLATGKTFTSGPVGSDGQYSILVPTNARYALDGVIAPDGSKVPVEGQVPLRVTTPGTYRMDVRLVAQAAPAPRAEAPTPPRATPTPPPTPPTRTAEVPSPPEEKRKDKSAVPWYKKPGGIVAIVVGTVGIAAAAGGGGGNNGSPSQP